MSKRKCNCYYCKKEILEGDLITVKVPSVTKNGVRNYTKNLHAWCKEPFIPRLREIVEESKVFEDVKLSNNTVNCYYCGHEVSERDVVKKDIPLSTKSGRKDVERIFHLKCVSAYIDGMDFEREEKVEDGWWDKCYKKFKSLIDVPEDKNLEEHAVLRILGLRVGRYVPNGSNVRGLKRGYDYETILYTMMFCTTGISHAMSTMNFKDQSHKIDYAMKIITNNINFMEQQVKAKRKSERRLESVIIEDKTKYEEMYQVKADKDNSEKIKSVVDSLIKDDVDSDLSAIDKMFGE